MSRALYLRGAVDVSKIAADGISKPHILGAYAAEVKEVALATPAVHQEGLYVAAGPDCPSNLVVAEGPAKVENGRVTVFLARRMEKRCS